jgi:hypothetical protein
VFKGGYVRVDYMSATSLMLDIFWAFGGERLFEVFVPDETAVFCIVKLCEYCEL